MGVVMFATVQNKQGIHLLLVSLMLYDPFHQYIVIYRDHTTLAY